VFRVSETAIKVDEYLVGARSESVVSIDVERTPRDTVSASD
jgi:hypothetical protein